jgi:CubicO group peptidase (beta-lactamase class C family)
MSQDMNHDLPPTPAEVAALDALFAPLNRGDAPGLVVGVARDGVTLYRRGFGLASIEHGVANMPSTRMRIGSTSKHFTCVAALLLAEQGLLDIDAGVRRYLPELPEMADEPTLRQLMTHTGGLRDSLDVGFLASGMTIKPRGESMAVQRRQRDVNFPPGERVVYNNGGYHMLSLVIERVAGMPFEDFLRQRIFAPLRMRDTESVPSDFALLPGVATLHVPQPGGRWRRGMFPSEEVLGEGAIVSTVDDMLRWLAHLRQPDTVGSAAAWAQMLAPARLNNGMLTSYALGLQVETYRGVGVVHHGGTVIGGHCQMLTVPGHALDIILISNGAPVGLADLANRIIDAVLGEDALPLPPDAPAETAAFAPLVGAWYASPSADMVVGFGDVDGKLGLIVHNAPPIAMRAAPGALWLDFNRVATGPYRVAIGPLAAGATAPLTLAFDDAGTPQTLERLPAPPPLDGAGAALVGRYRAHDLAADVLIAFEGDALVARIAGQFGPSVLALTAFSPDLFGWKFVGDLAPLGGTLRVERDERDGGAVSGLRLNTLRTRHLHFQRLGD